MNKVSNSIEGRWRELARSIRESADSVEYRQFSQLAQRVRTDAEHFASLPVPTSEQQWAERRKMAAITRKQWSVDLSNLRTGSDRRPRFPTLRVEFAGEGPALARH